MYKTLLFPFKKKKKKSTVNTVRNDKNKDDPNPGTDEDEVAPVPPNSTFVTLMESGNWPSLRTYLSSPRGKFDLQRFHTDRDLVDRNVLHNLCAFSPPPDVVRTVSTQCPDLLGETDCMLQTPLHVAVARGAETNVLEALISEHRAAAGMRDARGRTPLCVAAGMTGHGTDDQYHPDMRSILVLINAYPMGVLLEDRSGMTPLEHAVAVADESDEYIRLLQHATMRVQKEMAKRKRRDVLRQSTFKESIDLGPKRSTLITPSTVEVGEDAAGVMFSELSDAEDDCRERHFDENKVGEEEEEEQVEQN